MVRLIENKEERTGVHFVTQCPADRHCLLSSCVGVYPDGKAQCQLVFFFWVASLFHLRRSSTRICEKRTFCPPTLNKQRQAATATTGNHFQENKDTLESSITSFSLSRKDNSRVELCVNEELSWVLEMEWRRVDGSHLSSSTANDAPGLTIGTRFWDSRRSCKVGWDR